MLLEKRLRNFLICLSLINLLIVTTAFAQPVLKVEKGQIVPFSGWCLTNDAMAKIIADKELEGDRCKLKLDKQKDELSAKFNLEIDTLNIRLEALQGEYLALDQIKSEEIQRLEEAALKQPNDYWYLFTAAGFVVGATFTLGIWAVMAR